MGIRHKIRIDFGQFNVEEVLEYVNEIVSGQEIHNNLTRKIEFKIIKELADIVYGIPEGRLAKI